MYCSVSKGRYMYDWAEFRHFRYLLAILERRGFRAAAEQLHTSQPNLTVQARQFQDRAGVRLFRRSKAGHIRTTESGAAFIGLARYLLDVRDEVIDAIVAVDRGEIASICCASTSLVDQELFRELCSMHKRFVPSAAVRPTHGDLPHLIEEVTAGTVDIALVTLPFAHPDIHVEELRQDRLVVCMRKDSPLADRAALVVGDLPGHLKIFYHPQKHPDQHARLLAWLNAAGLHIREYSRVSHPSEMQALVRGGFGMALVPEGMPLDEQLTSRPVVGVDWAVDTALIYHKQRHPKTIPILVRQFKKEFGKLRAHEAGEHTSHARSSTVKRPSASVSSDTAEPIQLRLLG
jgi:DNA-binding transcriptional LysR family regulator